MADDDDDDDDFEDLFSFGGGASTPGAPSASASSSGPAATREPLASSSTGGSNNDFDILSDVSLSSSAASGGGGGGSAPSSSAGIGKDATPRTPGGNSSSGAVVDEFDALFGTPPVTPATTRAPAPTSSSAAAVDADALLLDAVDEIPPGGSASAEMASMDDFHVHDEDTRDMLDWLDDDVVPASSSSGKEAIAERRPEVKNEDAKNASAEEVEEEEDEEDDFDFDQMIAESASGEGKGKDVAQKQQISEQEQDGKSDPVESSPAPLKLQRDTSNIEQELALDQWEDDDDDDVANEGEVEDLQRTTDGDDNSQGEASSQPGANKQLPSANRNVPQPPKIKFSSLSEAIRSNASTLENVRSLFRRERGLDFNAGDDDAGVGEEDRAHLWTKVVCGKILEDVENGSLADSYREWEKKNDAPGDNEERAAAIDSLLKRARRGGSDDDVSAIGASDGERRRLLMLSHFHGRRRDDVGGEGKGSPSIDPLVPPVALAALRAGMPLAAASVFLSQIEPSAMPLLRLSNEERYLATEALHADFYLLACYHLPLLVMHLDRHCPGWYWPKKESTASVKDEQPVADNHAVAQENNREGEKSGGDEAKAQAAEEEGCPSPRAAEKNKVEENGLVPLFWFVTIFAGECGGACLEHKYLLPLWDNVLTKGDHSWKYFLAIAVLEKNSDLLLMARGEDLKLVLEKVLNFEETSFAEESFVGASEGKSSQGADGDGDDTVSTWLLSAKSLIESTPSSVIELLRSADDRAVASALKVRQRQVDKDLQAQLDAHEEARRKEIEERDAQAAMALNKARLTAYYRTYNPEKMDTIPQILKLFDGRMGVLNEKLKNKYGKGFLPDEDLKDQTRSFFMSVNQSITETRKHVSVTVAERRKKNTKSTADESRSKETPVALEISATEVIPVICTTKAHNLATGKKLSLARRTSDTVETLKFYLVDCRPESTAAEQGRFPTAVTMSPEKLQDPDELQKLTDMFESLRGAVHICVMGEGFASFPVLYNHTLSNLEEKLLQDDLARTSDCALFFLKKGFPFVSVLRGGFAAAHAFLSRNGPPMGMSPPEVLIEYDPDVSPFALLENARQEEEDYKNAPAREKTARTLQKMIDNSMTRLTMEENRINDLANELAKPETVVKMKQSVSNFLSKPKTVPSIGFGRTPPLFMSKKFVASPTNKEEDSKKVESTQEDKTAKSSAAISVMEKINLKLVSLPSESSSTALSDNDSGVDNKEPDSAKDSEPPNGLDDSATKDTVGSKISFTSFTNRMKQVTTTDSNETEDASPEISPGTSSDKEKNEGGSKISFTSFTNRMKQVTATEGSNITKDSSPEISPGTTSSDKEKNEGDASDNPSKVSTAFASFTQRMHQSTATVSPDSDKKESTASKISFSGFTNKIKLGHSSGDKPTIPSVNFTEGKDTEGERDPTPGTSEEKEKQTEDESTDKPADGGRFTKFTKSFGGTFAGLRETVDAKDPAKTEESIPEKSEAEESKTNESSGKSADRGKFTKFAKSFGGTVEGLRETAAAPKISEGNENSVPESREEQEKKKDDSNNKSAAGAKFTNFTKSLGGTLAVLRESAADAKASEEKEVSIPNITEGEKAKTDASTDNLIDNFTKSFAGLMQSKADSSDPKAVTEREEPGPMAKRISDLGKSSMGKLLFEDQPLPKTRFQRLDAEESISFDTDNESEKASNTDSLEDGFADISLTDVSVTDSIEDGTVQEGGNPVGSKENGDV